MQKIRLADAFEKVEGYWSPRLAARVNGTDVRLARLKGEFVWHAHAEEDELFLVVEGTLLLRFRDREVTLGPGEMLLVPRGVEHCPVAPQECRVLLIEPATTVNTGAVREARTQRDVPPL